MGYKKSGNNKNIQHKTIKGWRSDFLEDEKGKQISKSELMTESWIVNGRETPPKIIRREFFPNKDGGWKAGKAKGLSQSDYYILLKRRKEIAPTLGMPASELDKIFLEDQVVEDAPF